MDNFDTHKWFKKQYLAEDSLNDQAKRYFLQKVKRGEIDTLPENPKEEFLKQMMKDQMDHDEETLRRELNENMSPTEAVVELNYLMDELQNISGEVKQIMQQTFPDEYTRGDAYGAFDFGTSSNRYDVTFEGILDDLASVGDDME
jgi:hypothetical protein